MTTFQSIIDLCARRSLGHPGYGWIDAQPAVQPTHSVTAVREVANTVQFMLIGNGIDGTKGAQEGLT